MLDFEQYIDPFSVDGLINLPLLTTDPSDIWRPLQCDSQYKDIAFELGDFKSEPLGDLQSSYFKFDSENTPLLDLKSLELSTSSSETEYESAEELFAEDYTPEVDEDIWAFPDVVRPPSSSKLISWDTFSDPTHQEPGSAYISELEPAYFDKVTSRISQDNGQRIPSKVAGQDTLLFDLFELGLGRQSVLFSYDEARRSFVQIVEEFGISGLSVEIQHSVIRKCTRLGNSMKTLRNFISNSSTDPLFISFFSSLAAVVYGIERYLEQSRHCVYSILQLQQILERPAALVDSLCQMLRSIKSGVKPDTAIECLVSDAEQITIDHCWLEDILHDVVSRTVVPVLRQIEVSVGLRQDSNNRERQLQNNENLKLTLSANIIPIEISNLISESETALQLLQAHRPDHPVLGQVSFKPAHPSLSWECSWESIERLQRQANEYQNSLRELVRQFDQGLLHSGDDSDSESISFGWFEENLDIQPEDDDTQLLDLTSNSRLAIALGIRDGIARDNLSETVVKCLSTDAEICSSLKPSLMESLSFSIGPLLTAQHRLLSFSVLQLLFKTYNLRSHLQLQHRFQLLNDGLFASRLSQALFDPDQANSEGKRKAEGVRGLRLQTRDTWPPASSELRLVLMGILAESSKGSSPGALKDTLSTEADHESLSEAMSFSIRDLSDSELEKCRNADSIHALDFLRLHYKAPSSLIEAIITPKSLEKLDIMFKHLLRLLRVKHVATSLIRDVASRGRQTTKSVAHRFRIEIQHFVLTLANYSETIAIGSKWSRFQGLLYDVEECVQRDDFEEAIKVAGSLDRLRDVHEETLDSIMRTMFLDRRQEQVASLLEDTFDLILRFAASLKQNGVGDEDHDNIKKMQREFRKQVEGFIHYLRDLTDDSTTTGKRSFNVKEVSEFEQLLLRLNMFGYYD